MGYVESLGAPVQGVHGGGRCGMHMRSNAMVKRKRSCANFVLKCTALHCIEACCIEVYCIVVVEGSWAARIITKSCREPALVRCEMFCATPWYQSNCGQSVCIATKRVVSGRVRLAAASFCNCLSAVVDSTAEVLAAEERHHNTISAKDENN